MRNTKKIARLINCVDRLRYELNVGLYLSSTDDPGREKIAALEDRLHELSDELDQVMDQLIDSLADD